MVSRSFDFTTKSLLDFGEPMTEAEVDDVWLIRLAEMFSFAPICPANKDDVAVPIDLVSLAAATSDAAPNVIRLVVVEAFVVVGSIRLVLTLPKSKPVYAFFTSAESFRVTFGASQATHLTADSSLRTKHVSHSQVLSGAANMDIDSLSGDLLAADRSSNTLLESVLNLTLASGCLAISDDNEDAVVAMLPALVVSVNFSAAADEFGTEMIVLRLVDDRSLVIAKFDEQVVGSSDFFFGRIFINAYFTNFGTEKSNSDSCSFETMSSYDRLA